VNYPLSFEVFTSKVKPCARKTYWIDRFERTRFLPQVRAMCPLCAVSRVARLTRGGMVALKLTRLVRF